jgi:hypothetical protein
VVSGGGDHGDDDVGGDPACWLDQVCEDCGRLREGDGPHVCPVGVPVPAPAAEAVEAALPSD